jgi:hypothetical protein
VSNFVVETGAPTTVTFNVSWNRNSMPDVWSDTVWVFVDYLKAGRMERMPLLPGATLTNTSAADVGKVVEVSGNNTGVWVVGNAKTADAGSFSATVQLLTATADLHGACAYASNYPPVAEYTDATHLLIKGVPMYKMVIAAGANTYTAYSDGSYTLSRGHTLQSFTDKTGAPGTMTCRTPDVYELRASAASFCAGSSVTFALSNTTAGKTYRLFRGSNTVSTLSATGGAATFTGAFAGAGVYTAQVDAEGEYCPAAMSGTRAVVEKPVPVLLLSSETATATQTVDQNKPIADIVYMAANANIDLSSGSVSLPTGVSGVSSGTSFTISGTPTASGTFNYTVTATHTNGGCTNTLSGAIMVLSGTPPYAASTQTWTFGTSTLTWSDRIIAPDINCQLVAKITSSTTDAAYVVYSGHYYYSWYCVDAHKTTLCPAPWRVPNVDDLNALTKASSKANITAAWGQNGWFDVNNTTPDYSGQFFFFWTTTTYNTTYAYEYNQNLHGQQSWTKKTATEVICVK